MTEAFGELTRFQDREAEPRFSNSQTGGAGGRGGFGGGMQGGYGGGGYGGGGMMGGGGGGGGGAGRQIYISNVCGPKFSPPPDLLLLVLTASAASVHRWLAGSEGSFQTSW